MAPPPFWRASPRARGEEHGKDKKRTGLFRGRAASQGWLCPGEGIAFIHPLARHSARNLRSVFSLWRVPRLVGRERGFQSVRDTAAAGGLEPLACRSSHAKRVCGHGDFSGCTPRFPFACFPVDVAGGLAPNEPLRGPAAALNVRGVKKCRAGFKAPGDWREGTPNDRQDLIEPIAWRPLKKEGRCGPLQMIRARRSRSCCPCRRAGIPYRPSCSSFRAF